MENVWNARIPRINEPAPDFTARTTHGSRSLQDYRGKWLILFSHPADFTPVCTTEFLAFAGSYDRFRKLGCELLGLSIDSTYSHLAWIRNIKEKFGVEIPFPIIDDLSMRIAHDYGMIQPGASDTSAVRATFFIDPEIVFSATSISIRAALIAILGGVGTLAGPIIGALIIVPLEEVLSAYLSNKAAGIAPLIFGFILIGIVIWRPNGLASLFSGRRRPA